MDGLAENEPGDGEIVFAAAKRPKVFHRAGYALHLRDGLFQTIVLAPEHEGAKPKKKKIVMSRLQLAWETKAKADAATAAATRTSTTSEAVRAFLASCRSADRANGKGAAAKSGKDQYGPEWASFENFILTLYAHEPTHPDFVMVMRWRSGDPTFDQPITSDMIETYYRYLTGDKYSELVAGSSIQCRGAGFPSIQLAQQSIVYFHRLGCRVRGPCVDWLLTPPTQPPTTPV